MTKIKKIKKDLLEELGDEFEVLSDAEVADSGIEVAADEVLVVSKPAPTIPAGGDGADKDAVIKDLRTKLHDVNQESADRRIKLREAQTTLANLKTENESLKTEKANRAQTETKDKAKTLFDEYVGEKKLEFISPEAGSDIMSEAFNQIDWTKPVTKETIGPVVDSVVEKKKYALKQVVLPRTDGGPRSVGTDGVIDVDLAAIAQKYNIPYKEEKKE